MAAGSISAEKGISPGFFDSLSSAACEWFLILLLLVNASLTYLAEKFARYCELNSPCMLCSRLDCVLGKAKPGGYWNLLCKNHREEISSLVSCSVHCIADSPGMCEGCAIDPLSHIGYAKLKRSLDSELVAPRPEDDDGRNPCYYRNYGSKSEDDSCFRRSRTETPSNNVALDKWNHQGFEVMPSVLDQPNLIDSNDSSNVISSSSDAFKECGSRNLDWAESFLGPSSCLRADMMTLNYDLRHEVGVAEASKSNDSLPHMPALPFVFEPLSLYDVPSLDNMVPIPQKSINIFETSEKESTFATKHTEFAAAGSFDNICSSYSNDTNLSKPLTLSHGIKNKSISGQSVVQPIFLPDSVKIKEDMNSLEPISVARLGLSINNNGHKAHYQPDESREKDCCRFHLLPFSASLMSNGSGVESSEEISFYGAEGESTIDRLKRMVEKYRRCLNFLFRELEEERNAAAIAANQAMAMITRLQEQKAASHMEALQYLRILEEQAEYVMEELERANDLLAEKEEELQALKTELELGGNCFLDETLADDPHQEILKVPNHDISHVEYSPCTLTNAISARVNYEDEKLYISQSLKNLCQVYCCRRVDDMPSGLYSEKGEIEVENLDDLNMVTLSNKEDEGSDSFVQRVVLESIMSLSQNGTPNAPPAHFKPPDLMWGDEFVGEMNKTLSFSTSILEITSATLES